MGDSLMEFLEKFGVIFLVILNIIFLLLGAGIMGIGIYMRTNGDFINSDVTNFLNQISTGSVSFSQLLEILIIIVICIGVFTIITSLCGGVGAFAKLRGLLICYVIILVLCILIELVVLGFWISLLTGINDLLKSQFESLLKNYNGPSSTDVNSIGWNVIFILFGCCGVTPVSSSYNDFESLPSAWWSGGFRGSDLIPQSCCSDATISNYATYSNTACTQSWSSYYTSGCYDVFLNLFTQLAAAAISICVVLVIVEVTSIVFSILIVYRQTKRKSEIV